MTPHLLPGHAPPASLQESNFSENELPEEVQSILLALPEAQRATVQAILVSVLYHQPWQGPLPPPEVLKAYNDAFPNGAERIFAEVQRQARHRIEMERTVIPEQQRQSRRGQVYGLIVALSFLVSAFVLISMGYGLFGTIMGSIDLVALVTVFVVGRRQHIQALQHSPTH